MASMKSSDMRISKAIAPTVWIMAERLLAQIFGVLIFAVQAPILGPHAFGIVSLVLVFIVFWDVVVGTALIDGLLSIRFIEPRHFSAVTGMCALSGTGLGITAVVLAGPLATVLGDSQLAPVMRVMAVLPLMHGLAVSPMAAAERALQFRSTALRTTAGLFAGGVVGLVLTLAGSGVWALVWQAVVQRSVATIVLWLAVPIPFSVSWSWRHFCDVLRFAWPGMFARGMGWASGQLPRFILGLYVNPAELGLFVLAARLNDIVTQVAIIPRAVVARVELSRVIMRDPGFGQAVAQVFSQVSFIGFPLSFGIAALAPTLFHAWLDPRWNDGIVPTQILMLSVVPFVTMYIAGSVLRALNLQKLEAILSFVHGVAVMVAAAVAARFGITATAAAVALLPLAIVPLTVMVMRYQAGVALSNIFGPQARAAVASCLMAIVLLMFRPSIEAWSNSMTSLPIEIALGAVLYLVTMVALQPTRAIKTAKGAVYLVLRTLER